MLHTTFSLAYLHLTLSHFKGQGHAYLLNISQTVTDRVNIAISNTESRVWPFFWDGYV